MPETEFQITTVRHSIGDGIEMAEALGFPELSALGETVEEAESRLGKKLRQFLSNAELCPALEIHRRRLKMEAVVSFLSLEFTPPRRAPQWQLPAKVHIDFVRWSEREDLHHGYIPALNLGIFTPRPEDLEKRLTEHVKRVLAIRYKRLNLKVLESIHSQEPLTLGQLSISVQLPSPLDLELAAQTESKAESVLRKLAEELPPLSSPTNGETPPPAAYEVDELLQQLASILSGPRPRSVLLVGPPGCGKTAIVREFARRRAHHGFPHTTFWSTSGSRLMQGQAGFGMWQERCLKMCRELSHSRGILHLGPLPELLEVGRASRGGESVASFLRPWLARGEVLAIAECTASQLDAIQRADPQLLQALVRIEIREPAPEITRKILRQLWNDAPGIVAPTPTEAIDWILRLHTRYGTYSANPGRPVRFLRQLLADQFPSKQLSPRDVTRAFTRETGLPEVLLEDNIPLDLRSARDWFLQRVIGQPQSVDKVLDVLALIKTRLARPRRPLASLLFIGPTGTGKTELARSLATYVFGDASRLVRFDLSEFNDPISVQRLIGGLGPSPEGLLTARVREQPFLVLLLDEFEKADASFFDLLLQILGEGRLTDAAGRVADFCNAVIVMTSNLGAESLRRGPSGFGVESAHQASEAFADAVRQFLRPEIYNRIDALVPFAPLDREVVATIARRQLDLVLRRDGLSQRRVELQIGPGVAEYLAESGFDARYGARPLKRKIEQEFVAPLAEALNGYDFQLPLHAQVECVQKRLKVRVTAATGSKHSLDAENSLGFLASQITGQRRAATQLLHCREARELENQASLLAVMDRRLAKGRWKSPAQQQQLNRLPELRTCLDQLADYDRRVAEAETKALLALYSEDSREELRRELQPVLTILGSEYQSLQRDLFRMGYERPDECVLALFSEPRGDLLHLATAYAQLMRRHGSLEAVGLFFIPTARTANKSTLVRTDSAILDSLFPHSDPFREISYALRLDRSLGASRPSGELACVLLHGTGPSFWPLFLREDGKHAFEGVQSDALYLVQALNTGFADFTPTRLIHTHDFISKLSCRAIRTLSEKKQTITDSILGTVPWEKQSLEELLDRLLEGRLSRAIQNIGRQEST